MGKRGQSLEAELRAALENTERREAEIAALFEASRSILEYRHFHEAAQTIFEAAKKVMGATAGYVALLSENGLENEVLFVDSGGFPCEVDPSLPMPIRGLRALAHKNRRATYHNDFNQSEYAHSLPPGQRNLSLPPHRRGTPGPGFPACESA
jgi:hypothetical protein